MCLGTIRNRFTVDCPYRTMISFGYMLLKWELKFEYIVYSWYLFVHFERNVSQVGWSGELGRNPI